VIVDQRRAGDVAELPRRAETEELVVEREEAPIAVIDGDARPRGIELAGEEALVLATAGGGEGEARDPALSVLRVALVHQCDELVFDLARVEPDDLGHRVGGGEAFQPQTVQHEQAGIGRVAHRTSDDTDE
jgi:hypothetical protein